MANKVATKATEFRAALLAAHDRKEKITVDWEGHKILMVEPNAKERSTIRKACMTVKSDQTIELDQALMAVLLIIQCARDIETGEAIFQPADRDALLSLPSRIIDAVAGPALKWMGQGQEQEAKN